MKYDAAVIGAGSCGSVLCEDPCIKRFEGSFDG